MKVMKMIMAVAMVMLLAACGGKKFDAEKADALCHKYYQGDFEEKDWTEFGDMYEASVNVQKKFYEDLLKEAEPGANIDQLRMDLYKQDKEVFDAMSSMEDVAYKGRDKMPEKVADQIKAAEDKIDKIKKEYREKIEKKIDK